MKRSPDTLGPERGATIRSGYVLLYRGGLENVCPCCGQRQWFVGRTTAECAFCETALPLAQDLAGHESRRTLLGRAA